MSEIEFPFLERESRIFGRIRRPLIEVRVFSEVAQQWILLRNVLADSGADLSILPLEVGRWLVRDAVAGRRIELSGIVPGQVLAAHLHELGFRLGPMEFRAPVAVAESRDAPLLLGRRGALDRFEVRFLRGRKTVLRW